MDSPSANRPARRLLAALPLLVGLGACGSATQTEQVWMPNRVTPEPPLQNVVALFQSDNVTVRRAGEDRLARELAEQGVRATPAYTILTDQEVGDIELVRSTLAAKGYDGIVTMKLVDREQTVEYVPGFDGGYYGEYMYYGHGLYVPDHSYTETTYRVEASAYSLRSHEIVWSGIISTINPDDAREMIRDTTEEAVEQLSTRGVTRERGPG